MRKIYLESIGKKLFIFKRWGGKNYSLFHALKKQIRICVLLLSYFQIGLIDEVHSQTDSLQVRMEFEMDEIEVKAQRAPGSYSQLVRLVSIIDRAEIESAPVGSVQELLEYALGVDIRQRGTHGVQADIAIRGGSFDQTLILLNGINISDPQTGHHNLNLPLSLKSIKRIEILIGSGARVYGPNAFSGAINIITEPGNDTQLRADILHAEHQLSDFNVAANIKTGKLSGFLALNRKSSDGYIENTDFEKYSIFYNGKIESETGNLDFQAGYSLKSFGANSFYTPRFPNQYEKTKTIFASVKFKSNSKIHLSPAVYWRRHQDRFELFRNNAPDWYSGHNYHLTDVYGLSVNSWFKNALGKTAFGAEFRSENIWSNVLGEPMNKPIDVPGEEGQQFTNSANRTHISYFAEHNFSLNRFTVSMGIMANWITGLNFDWNVYPGLDVGYTFSDNIRAYASVSKSMRMPTFTDLYYDGPTNKGNPDLKPEESTSWEGGFKFRTSFFRGHLGYFHQKGKNLIDWVKESEEFEWTPMNLTEINSHGIEVSNRLIFRSLDSKNFFLKEINLNYSYVKLKKGNNNYFSNYVLDNLKHKLVLSIDQSIYKNLSLLWKFRYQEREGTYSSFENTEYKGEAEYKPFWITDVKISWQVMQFMIYGQISNLFNRQYVDFGNVKQPVRWLSAGVSYKLNMK